MRTTIEITDEQRAKLLGEAAKRGDKGFSTVIRDALDLYFAGAEDRRERIERGLKALGSLAGEGADRLEKDVRNLRRTWR